MRALVEMTDVHHLAKLILEEPIDLCFLYLLVLVKQDLLLSIIKRHVFDDRVSKGMVNLFSEFFTVFVEFLKFFITEVLLRGGTLAAV